MKQLTNIFWTLSFPVSLLILAGAYYIKIPSAREYIDARTSLGHTLFGNLVHDSAHSKTTAKSVTPPKSTPPIKAEVTATATEPLGSLHNNAPAFAESPGIPAPPEAIPRPAPVFDLQALAGDPAHWPKKVTLKKEVIFPAVINGKVVGSVVAHPGEEANLRCIKDGKIGLEYKGGGVWLTAEDTDLASRVVKVTGNG